VVERNENIENEIVKSDVMISAGLEMNVVDR
jgi:hypothetical protein